MLSKAIPDVNLPSAFAALGDARRFAIVSQLLEEGEQTAGALARQSDVSAPAISRHLKVLRGAGILRQRVDGQRRVYTVEPNAMQAISAWTMAYRDFWEGSLDRLEQALEKDTRNDRP